MNDTEKLLSAVHKTANMGMESLNALIPETQDSSIKRTLRSQLDSYSSFLDEAGSGLLLRGQEPKQQGVVNKLMLDMNVKMNAKINQSPSHIAEMMIQGSNMGIIEVQKALNHAPEAAKEAKSLAKDLLEFEQNSVDAYKKFL